jgi:hypothetical protein
MSPLKNQKKKIRPTADGKVVKKLTSPKEEVKKEQKYVRADRVEFFKQSGWKTVNRDITKRVEGVKTHANDLILMEK